MMQVEKGMKGETRNNGGRHQWPVAHLLLALALALIVVGCSSHGQTGNGASSAQAESNSAPTVTIAPEARKEAQQTFSTQCATCHGPQGRGDGPGAARLNPKPANFTDPNWQKSVTDDQIEKVIVYGGAAVGKSPAMPANTDLQNHPAVVAALRQMIRQLGGQPPAK